MYISIVGEIWRMYIEKKKKKIGEAGTSVHSLVVLKLNAVHTVSDTSDTTIKKHKVLFFIFLNEGTENKDTNDMEEPTWWLILNSNQGYQP